MKEHIEKEYKVLLNREQFDVLIELLQPEPAFCQTNRYFDTAERYLQKHGARCGSGKRTDSFCLH